MNDLQGNILQLFLSLPAFVAAFTVHEFAHAWAAYRLGDDTAQRMGRLSLDPLVHLDPFGSLMFVMTQLVGFGIGWAKPVPFTMRNLGHPRRDSMLIAVAGPISNLLQVPFWMGLLWLFRVALEQGGSSLFSAEGASPEMASLPGIVMTVLSMGIIVNVLLAAFNMIPFPPLDGHYILEGLGPPAVTDFFNSIRPYSFMILIGLSYFGILGIVLRPAIELAYRLVGLALGAGA